MERLAHPLTIVRAALDVRSRLSNLRKQGDLQLVMNGNTFVEFDDHITMVEANRQDVDTNLSVHAQRSFPLAEAVAAIERQVRNTQAFCRRAAEAQFFQPGCPMHYNRPLPPVSN